MKVLNDNGESVTAQSRSVTYVFSESRPADLQRENDILKQRCAFHANPEICRLCKFKCSYRKKWSYSND